MGPYANSKDVWVFIQTAGTLKRLTLQF